MRIRDLIIVGPGILYSLLIFVLTFDEWIRIGLIADPQEIEQYYFSSEAMIYHGGWTYKSAALYAWTNFGTALFTMLLLGFFGVGFVRKSRRYVYLGYAGHLVLLIFFWFP